MQRNLRHELEDLKQGPISQEESCSELLDFATRTVTKMRGKEMFAIFPSDSANESDKDTNSSACSESDEDSDGESEIPTNKHRAIYKAAVQFEKELETLLESIRDSKKRFHKKLRRLSKE